MKIRSSRRHTAKVSHSRWLAYATAGAATALAANHSAEAAIHYSGRLEVKFPAHAEGQRKFQLDQPRDFFQLVHFGYLACFYIRGIDSEGFRGFIPQGIGGYNVSKLSFGESISAGGFVGSQYPHRYCGVLAGGSLSQWFDPGVGFVGFKFNNGAGVQYGWARVRMGGIERTNGFELLDYAYGDPGEPVSAGQKSSGEQAPDQGSLGGLALGAVGLLTWRKNRSQTAP
jgi:hypothetical protein